jgi:hypothetical protein
MKIGPLLALAALVSASAAFAESPKKAVLLDFSRDTLIDAAAAKAILADGIPAKVWKVYPPTKWGFASQVEGGLTQAGMCVVTARVMMVPLTQALKAPLLRPEKIATAFDAASGSSAEQCKALAKAKLGEATQSVVSSLVKP